MSQQLPVTHQYQSIPPRYGHYELQQAFVYQCYLSAVYDCYKWYSCSGEIKEFVYKLWEIKSLVSASTFIRKNPAFVKVMYWCQTTAKTLPKPMMTQIIDIHHQTFINYTTTFSAAKSLTMTHINLLAPGGFKWNFRLIVSLVKMPLADCHRALLIISQHWFR